MSRLFNAVRRWLRPSRPSTHRSRRWGPPWLEALEDRVAPTVDSWAMKNHDLGNTNQADFVVPANRLNNTFFDIFAWQKRTPGSPGDGNVDSSSMVFFDGAGPNGKDIVVSGYHWPKGVAGLDRHTGQFFWASLPDGGESIGANTPAFANGGGTVYVTNDATSHPLMAFATATGPGTYWSNGADPNAGYVTFSPRVTPDGRVFAPSWNERPFGWTDSGTALSRTWQAADWLADCYSLPAFYQDGGRLDVIGAGRVGLVEAFDGGDGHQLWSVASGVETDASPTVDPANGHVYLPAIGSGTVSLVGLDKNGQRLWSSVAEVVDTFSGTAPQRTMSAGALSFDGGTYYFETIGDAGDGKLYAINTADGSVKWSYATGSKGGEMNASSPIVTRNGVIVVGNNLGGTYFALQDVGGHPVLLDTFREDAGGNAAAGATLARDGTLYLPLHTTQVVGAAGEAPSLHVENLFTALDLTANATPLATLPPPSGQAAFVGNHSVRVQWTSLLNFDSVFDHYAVYRSTQAFTSVTGLTPIATLTDQSAGSYVDAAAQNGTAYYYAVTIVAQAGGETKTVSAVGPRTPRDETDLQVVSVARSPQYPRYAPTYQGHTVTETSGYGPYNFSASDGLGNGQTANTQRWPKVGDAVTYTATVRNRGTNEYHRTLTGHWLLDGTDVLDASQAVDLQPGDSATFTYLYTWDQQPHALVFRMDAGDARAANDALTTDTMAVPYLTYIDRSFAEDFTQAWTPSYPGAKTDDLIDWLNDHMAKFNQMLAAAGTQKRVGYGVLQVIDDGSPDPNIDQSPYAIFPFRYHHGSDGDPRTSGYYSAADDIDYGLLHEMGHQMGLIDLYQLDVPAGANQVSGQAYNGAPTDLMHTVAPVISTHTALALQHWLNVVHGYYGQFLYDMPATLQLRVLGRDGLPLSGATVQMFQYVDRPGVGKVITNQVKAAGTTDANGLFTLPNVPIDPSLVPPAYTGDTLHDNPFGYVDVVGTNGVLLFKVKDQGEIAYAWLDVTEANVAYWQGHTGTAVFDRNLKLGGPIQTAPPAELTEQNAADWTAYAQDATAAVYDDTTRKIFGKASLRFETNGGFDTAAAYPGTVDAQWDLTGYDHLDVAFYAHNTNEPKFQNGSPWIRLVDLDGNYYQYQYYTNGGISDVLNEALDRWQAFRIPLNASDTVNDGWRRTAFGTPDLTHIHSIEVHSDTWGYGFTLWIDALGFHTASANDPPLAADAGFSAPDHGAVGKVVGTVQATDPDPGDALHYAIISGNELGGFAIDPNTGTITVADSSVVDHQAHPTFTLKVRVTDLGGLSADATVTVAVLAPPTVTSGVVNGNSAALAGAQRSLVSSFVLTFDHAVTLAAGAITIGLRQNVKVNNVLKPTGYGTLPTLSYSSADGGVTWVMTFSGAGVVNGSIADGIYDLTVNHALVTDVLGQAMTADQVFTFYRLFGDADGNRKVNNADLAAFAAAFNKRSNQAGYLAYLDYDGSGRIDNGDLAQFANRFNSSFAF